MTRAAEAAVTLPGGTIDGKYRIVRTLGAGGMGVLLEAEQQGLGRLVAIKMLRAEYLDHEEVVARFLREGQLAATIESEHVSRVFDVGTMQGGVPYLVMELLRGEDLDARVRASGALPAPLAIDWLMQACEGVAEAHARGIVHRDLKPSNLFLSERDNGSICVKVLDFGISGIADQAKVRALGERGKITHTSQVLGSPAYMSPEQLRSASLTDARSDIWALGVILYEALSGKLPFYGESVPEIHAAILAEEPTPLDQRAGEIPAALAAIVGRCLAKKPADRYADVVALARALAPHGGEEAAASLREIERWQARLASALGARVTEPVLRVRDDADEPEAPMAARHDTRVDPIKPLETAPTRTNWDAPATTERSPATRRVALVAIGLVGLGLGALVLGDSLGGGEAAPSNAASAASPLGSTSAPVAPVPVVDTTLPAVASEPAPAPAPSASVLAGVRTPPVIWRAPASSTSLAMPPGPAPVPAPSQSAVVDWQYKHR